MQSVCLGKKMANLPDDHNYEGPQGAIYLWPSARKACHAHAERFGASISTQKTSARARSSRWGGSLATLS